MSFPTSPTNGQQVTIKGIVYTYNSTTTTWDRSLAVGTTNGSFNLLTANALTVNGATVVSTSSGNGNLTISTGAINLTSMGPGAATTGSATAIPVITTDAYGRISAITTASPSLTVNLSGTSGTGTVAANGGTLTFAGSNGVTASASGSTITLNTPQNLQTTAAPTFANLTVSGSALINSFDIRQERAQNLKITGAGAGAQGITAYDSGAVWKYQIYGDGSNYGFLDSNWGNWDINKTINGNMSLRVSGSNYTVLHAGNYSSYSPTLSGTGATGTWGISISGSAASATNATTLGGYAVAGARNDGASVIAKTDANGYLQCGYINSANGNEGNNSNPPRVWGTNGSDNYLRTYLTSALSVSYASSAGSVSVTQTGTNATNMLYAAIADNDFFRLRVGGDASNAGWVELATADDGTEPIYVRQYTGVFTTVARTATILDGSGNSTFPGSVTAYYSDERLKTKVGKIENALDKVDQLSGFLYVENELAKSLGFNNDQTQVALSAQAVQKVQPEAVALAPFDRETDGTSKSGENYLTVQYEKLVPLLVEAIKELRAELNTVKNQLRG